MFFQDLKEFSKETSIHGLGQIADDAATKTKRFIWIVIFVGSLTYAGVMLHDAYQGGYIFQIIWLNSSVFFMYFLSCAENKKTRVIQLFIF